MKKIIDFKDEIHKCSKCGLCQSVCPIYEQTGNDCTVSRGKFIMLNGIVKGDLKLNKNINKYLDMCLKCNACKDFCPSGIDARKIFLSAKGEYFENCPTSVFVKAFQSKFVFNLVLNLIKIATNLYRLLKFDKIINNRCVRRILQNSWLGKKAILANEFVSINAVGQECPTYCDNSESIVIEETRKQRCKESRSGIFARQTKVVYFKGCVNEYINPRSKMAAESILTQMGVEIIDAKFDCCGVPFLSCGNLEQFKKQAEYNLSQIPDDFDYFLTDCASCQNAFFEYDNYLEDEQLVEKLKRINEKSLNVVDFIVKNAKEFEFEEKTSFTFHKPCHLENLDFMDEFLKKSKNVEYVEMEEFDKCCGFSGEFALKNPELSEKISAKKAQNAINSKAQYIVTSCPACLLGLTQGLIEIQQDKLKPINFVEFILQAKITT